jgi:hypothetical protein
MKTIATIRLVAALVLASLPLTGCVADASTDESNAGADADDAQDGPVGAAEEAITGGVGLILYDQAGFLGNSITLPASAIMLGTWDNKAMSLKNDSDQPVVVYSKAGYLGRCQAIPPHVGYENLQNRDIGPQRLSSAQFNASCAAQTSTLTIDNTSLWHDMRFRTETNLVPGSWSGTVGPGGDQIIFTFSRNAWNLSFGHQTSLQYQSNWSNYTSFSLKTVDDDFIGDQYFADYYY